ncbi:MAG: hypothetical protein AAF202_02785, partial [Pseudomonadota bacterium]
GGGNLNVTVEGNISSAFNGVCDWDLIVVKPALQAWEALQITTDHRAVFTNYMDHPVGEMFAIYHAAQFYSNRKAEVCGLRAHHLFERHSYSEWVEGSGPKLRVAEGLGIGFDTLLENESWLPL